MRPKTKIDIKKKNVLFVSEYFPPEDEKNQTGGTISNRNLLRALAQKYDVTVLTFDRAAQISRFANEPYRVIQKASPTWRAPGIFLHWQDFVRRHTSEVVLNNVNLDFLIATTSTLGAFDAAQPGTKCVAVVQAFENFGFRCRMVPMRTRIDLMKGALLRRLQDVRYMRCADGILANSAFMRAIIADRFEVAPDHIHVLKQLIDFEPIAMKPSKSTVGFVHRGTDKNIALVMELAHRAPDINFLIYGHPRDLPTKLPANSSYMGWATDRSEMFASAGLWLVPSLWAEPFGRVSIEAQAAGRTVLVANRGGLPETVADDRYMIEGFEPESWIARMRQLLSLPEAEIADASSRTRKRFSQEAHDEMIIASFETITQSQRTRK